MFNWISLVLSLGGFIALVATNGSPFGFAMFMGGLTTQYVAVFGFRCQKCGKAWWSWTREERDKVPGYLFPSINRRNPGIVFPLKTCQHCGQERA